MAEWSNDKFGLVSFRSSDGVLRFQRDAAGNATERITQVTVHVNE